MRLALYFSLLLLPCSLLSQPEFNYTISLEEINLEGFPGIHSYAYGTNDNKWLIVGGRLDGLHARQPFNAFPENQNNDQLLVIDSETWQWWARDINDLPTALKEQLQSTNMNFAQRADTLYIAGGYAFSPTANDHITFPHLSSIIISEVIDAIINNEPNISQYFQQITADEFAVTGGQMRFFNGKLYLVGGHRFDGRYNPMGNPTYTQTYTNGIRMFQPINEAENLHFTDYSEWIDEVNLHRRDYNLLPDLTAENSERLIVSSGVFQVGINSPFLYPVIIDENGVTSETAFNQYLSNYHSAHATFKNTSNQEMHTLFFGGISNYYYSNGVLIQDDLVPFVKTISRLSRDASNAHYEFLESTEMPGFFGSSAEFIVNPNLSLSNNEIIMLTGEESAPIVAGYVLGGIGSNSLNPFSVNQTSQTWASSAIYRIVLTPNKISSTQQIAQPNTFALTIAPNPVYSSIQMQFAEELSGELMIYLMDMTGRLVFRQNAQVQSSITLNIDLPQEIRNGQYILHVVKNKIDHKEIKLSVQR